MKFKKSRVALLIVQRVGVVFFWVSGLTLGWAGGLEWEQTAIEIGAQAADKTVTVDFSFRNATDHPVEILKIRTSCGCTVADSGKKTYASGEKGIVKAVFTIGGRKGKQEKTILVETSEKKSSDVLILRVNLPDTLKINKEALHWNIGDPLEPQSFEVSVIEPGTARIVAANSLGDSFQSYLKEIKIGEKFQVIVTPVTTEHPVQGTICLEVNDPGSRAIYLHTAVEN